MLGLPVYYLISSVVGGVEVRPPLGDLGRALLSRSVLNLRDHPGVELELELELIQSQLAQKPMPRGEVGARAWRV